MKDNLLKSGKPYYGLCVVIWVVAFLLVPSRHYLVYGSLYVEILIASFVGMALLLIGMGLDVSGTYFGVLRSGRNTYSLSRLQMTLWTLLVLSALFAAALARTWAKGDASSALSIDIPGELLSAMGISYFTGFAAPAALALKSQAAATPGQVDLASARLGEVVYATGNIIRRPLGRPPLMADMVQGDDLATAGTVDLSKVQQLLITLLLIAVYFGMLLSFFWKETFLAVMTELPKWSDKFVGLMALSHAGYLAYKVAPRAPGDPATGTANVPALRPLPPDRLAP